MTMRNRDTLEAIREEHRLLAMLRTLLRLPGYAGNSLLLRDYLDTIGLVAGHDVIRSDIQRLSQMGLCDIDADSDADRVTLTERGIDVAEDRSQVPGIRRPGPECPY